MINNLPGTSPVIRWGMIGCGSVTEVKSGPAFQKASRSVLVAVMRRNGALARDYAQRHGVPRWYDNTAALIADTEVDAVYVATPVGVHLACALEVCKAGKPCYVEKPMARNVTESRLMTDAFSAAGLPLFVAYYRRALPRFLKARELVQCGRLGILTGIDYRYAQSRHRQILGDPLPWRYVAEQSGGGLFMDLGCHTLDIIDFIAGPLESVAGLAANIASSYPVEDNVVANFKTASGVLGAARWNFAAAEAEDMITFTGTEARLSLSTFGAEPLCIETATGKENLDIPNPSHIQQPLIQSIVNELLGTGKCPSTGESALRTACVMDRVLESYYGGRADDFWNRSSTWPGRRA